MRRFPIISMLLAWLLVLSTAACSRESPADTAAASAEDQTLPQNLAAFDPSNFDNPTTIDNTWLPLTPGTRFVYAGTTVEDDGTAVPHRIEVIITDLTKSIGGIETVVSWDLDYTDDELVEAELAFYAQDNDGNVWRMGEYPEEYDNGALVAAPTWIHGLAAARAGIHMLADPQPDTASYAQGWGPAVGWTDQGQVDQVGQETCVPVDCYQDVLIIAETSQSEPAAFQLKYYAQGIGNVRVGWRGEGEKTQEMLELVEYSQLSPDALAAARAAALQLEQSAYANSKDVYAQTPPIAAAGGVAITASTATKAAAPAPPVAQSVAQSAEIVVYTADLPESALYEFEIWADPTSPGGQLLGITNYGDELDPPPENDPHVNFTVPVQAGVPYRCWVHMLVGTPKGKSQANMLWVQFSDAVDQENNEVFRPQTASYLTVQGPTEAGWIWAPCAQPDADPAAALVYFGTSGEVAVRIQAGMEGVGFDQFLLSAAQFLEQPPTTTVVAK